MAESSPESQAPMSAVPDRSIDIALAEYNALRAELLGHSTSQNTVIGLGFTGIGVIVGLAVNGPGRRELLMLVPPLCAVVILVYGGLAYRIIVIGNYTRRRLWPFLAARVPARELPSWEKSLAHLESRFQHRVLSQVVELFLVLLLLGIGTACAILAGDLSPEIKYSVVAGLVGATAGGAWLAWRRRYPEEMFTRDE